MLLQRRFYTTKTLSRHWINNSIGIKLSNEQDGNVFGIG